MLSKNILSFAELTLSKQCLLNPRSVLRSSHTRGRFHSRTKLQPEPAPQISDPPPLYTFALVKPLVFTVGFASLSLGGCAVWQYEQHRAHAKKHLRRPFDRFNEARKKNPISQWWSGLKDSDKVFYPILAANVLVFGAWRVRSLQTVMVKYFCSNPASKSVYLPMVLSTFSHYTFLHLAANMFVLNSFMPAALNSMGKEQFVGMYLSAGVMSSFASYFYKTLTSQPGLSLGASGAIMAILGYVCVQYPETQLSIIFLPIYTFYAGNAIKVIMSLDLAGVLMGWKFFDHAAHLGGALFGIGWCTWGGQHIWGNRDKVQRYWHTLRETATSER